jgi:hypothetical protein
MGYKQTRPTWIAQDNAACIYLVKGAGMYNRAEHIDTRIYSQPRTRPLVLPIL